MGCGGSLLLARPPNINNSELRNRRLNHSLPVSTSPNVDNSNLRNRSLEVYKTTPKKQQMNNIWHYDFDYVESDDKVNLEKVKAKLGL